MRKNNKSESATTKPVTLGTEDLRAIVGGINGGLNRDIIRRTVPK